MVARGIFLLLAGPTATGKTVVLSRLLARSKGLLKDVSVTTRPPREGERDGLDYHFWELARFERAAANGEFLEHALVHGLHRYGTLKAQVQGQLEQGVDVIKDMDVQGVSQVRKVLPYPASVSVFMLPPSKEVLLARFNQRGAGDAENLARRLQSAKKEIERVEEYDYLLFNLDIEQVVEDLQSVRRAEHLRCWRRASEAKELWLKNL